jgi:hypothetical protein
MPQVVDDMADDTKSNAVDGAAWGLGTGIGQSFAGPLGYGVGGIAAGSYANDDTMVRMAIGDGLRMLLTSGSGGGSNSSGGRDRM